MIVLERGSDYADVSSDLSFLLAMTQSRFKKPKGEIILTLRKALAANHWNYFRPENARLMEAEILIAVKVYQDALNVLTFTSESIDSARLRLLAMRFMPNKNAYFRYTIEMMELYPREPAPARIFLEYINAESASGNPPTDAERQILDLIFRRLSLLLPLDPELAWMTAPFLRDTQEAARLVSAYRAVNAPLPASIPVSLSLGVIDEKTALNEVFSSQNRLSGIDVSLLDEVWELLHSDEGKDQFRRNIAGFFGTITADINKDGIPEAAAVYQNGMLIGYTYDEDQDGLPELTIGFKAGDPVNAVIAVSSDTGISRSLFSMDSGQRKIIINWEQYPAVLYAALDNERFIPRPFDFFYAPVRFRELSNSGLAYNGYYDGILFPEKDNMTAALTRRVLIANSLRVVRPSMEFIDATETVELNQSIPVRAWESLNGKIISETDFLRGRPISQRLDIDLDGYMDTFRSFRRFSLVQDGVLPPPEVLLDYEREFESVESISGNSDIESFSFFRDLF